MRVLVCGGRDFCFSTFLNEQLDVVHKEHGITMLIEGDASGADRMAGEWARHKGVTHLRFPALWNQYGKAAGQIRNRQMLDQGEPDLVIAFDGGRGTANMIQLATDAKVKVVQIKSPTSKSPMPPLSNGWK